MPATLNVITNLFNRSLNEGLFPDSLKTAKIVPLFKDGSKVEENNYRPISLLIIWSKTFEKVVFNRVYGYFGKLGILYHCINLVFETSIAPLMHSQNSPKKFVILEKRTLSIRSFWT